MYEVRAIEKREINVVKADGPNIRPNPRATVRIKDRMAVKFALRFLSISVIDG
jgi:hypothetical protein